LVKPTGIASAAGTSMANPEHARTAKSTPFVSRDPPRCLSNSHPVSQKFFALYAVCVFHSFRCGQPRPLLVSLLSRSDDQRLFSMPLARFDSSLSMRSVGLPNSFARLQREGLLRFFFLYWFSAPFSQLDSSICRIAEIFSSDVRAQINFPYPEAGDG